MPKDKFVRGEARKRLPRPQPPHEDRRLKRKRTRNAEHLETLEQMDEQEEDPEEVQDPNWPTLVVDRGAAVSVWFKKEMGQEFPE